MPQEDLSLPGIDPAPAATAPAPAAPAGPDTTTTTSAVVDAGAREAPVADADDTDEAGRPRRLNGTQLRINELTADRHALERRVSELVQQNAALVDAVRTGRVSGQEAKAQLDLGGADVEPKESDYKTWEEFFLAKAAHTARKELRAELAQAARQHNEQRQQAQAKVQVEQAAEATEQLHSLLGDQMMEAFAEFPDYEAVVGSQRAPLPVRVEAAMVISGDGGRVAYYLAKNPRVAAQLDRLPDMLLAHQIGRIAAHMKAGAASVSTAPPPGAPAGTRGGGPLSYPKDATPEQHLAYRKRIAAAAQKGA